jgi:PBP1b-binding outer membrane lipoprotein LpoB
MQEVEHMMRKLTIATTLALALFAAGCASKSVAPENPEPPPEPPKVECPEPGSTEPIPEGCPEQPHTPDVCTSNPGDKRCPDENQ